MHPNQTLALNDLPESIQNIVRLIGLPKALKLVDSLGGTSFPVAKGINRLGQIRFELLAEVVGVDAANALTVHYGGEVLYIPNCKEALRKQRDRAIHCRFDAMVKEGYSANAVVNVLALEHQLCDRRIWGILKVLPQESTQSALF